MVATRLTFGPFEIDGGAQVVLRGGDILPIGQRGVMLLQTLLSRPGEVLTKSELIDAAWGGAAVEESNLSVQIAALRKALGTSPAGGDWIATVPRVGYRFLGPAQDTLPALPPAEPHSIAVLPFTHLGDDADQRWFADGLSEDIITVLGKLPGLLVIARNSSFVYRDAPVDVRRIAAELDVEYLLEGSVRRSGNRLRVTAHLAEGHSGAHLWAERYDRELTDVFAIQDEIAGRIADALQIRLRTPEPLTLSHRTVQPEAYYWAARGREMLRGQTQNAGVYTRIVEAFHNATRHDPEYALPYVGLAEAHQLAHVNSWRADREAVLAEARACADKALALAPDDYSAYGMSALVALREKNASRARAEADRCLELGPNDHLGLTLRGTLLTLDGDPLAAIPFIERAMRLDPVAHQYPLHHLAVAHLVAGKYATAAALFRERIVHVPGTDMSRGFLIAALGHLDEREEARRVWDALVTITPGWSLADRLDSAYPFRRVADRDHLLAGWRKAGLPVGLDGS